MNIPKGHQTVMPYLIVKGAAKLTDFAQKTFNAEVTLTKMRNDGRTIMHSEIQIGDSTIMIADATEQWKPRTASIFVYVSDADQAFNKAIQLGAVTAMELSDQDYGRTCGVADPFGNVWWITSLN
ncbi:MAG: VOC family protein [Cyclobacteriaceae bacterium]